MHDTAYNIGGLVIKTYCNAPGASILEIGSRAINGSLRDHVDANTRYVGVDIEDGPGVDIVQEIGAPIPVDDATFDLVIASSVFEHDPAFWVTFVEMCRKVKKGGFLYLNVPSNGAVHRYPKDVWRFYPDAGLALADWATGQGERIFLVESFIAEREADRWNDFVAVYRKGDDTAGLPAELAHEQVRSVNVMTWKSEKLLRPRDATEDQVLLEQFEELQRKSAASLVEQVARVGKLQDELTQTTGAFNALREELVQARARSEELAGSNGGLQAQIDQIRREHDEVLRREVDHHARLQDAYSARERLSREIGEALEQARQLADERVEYQRRGQEAEIAREALSRDLAEARAKIEQLAGEKAERQTAQLEANAARESLSRDLAEARAEIERLTSEAAKCQAKLLEADAAQERLARDIDGAKLHARQRDIDHERLAAELTGRIAEISAAHQETQTALDELRVKNDELDRTASARLREIVTLTNYLRNREEEIVRSKQQEAWFKSVLQVVDRKSSALGILLPAKARRDIYRKLEAAHLFSDQKYLDRYPDVAQSGTDPLRHYIRHGIAEGRRL